MAYRAESDDITTDERLSNFETRLMWFMLNRMEFGNVLHMKQVRMAKALKVPPSQVKSCAQEAGSHRPCCLRRSGHLRGSSIFSGGGLFMLLISAVG
jgi:hypothetical protein